MKIETHPRDDHQVTVNVEVEAERMEGARRRAARRIAERTKIPGFRPGKAPYEVIRRQVGDGVIAEEAIDLLIDELYPEVLKQADIKPGAPGSLEKVESVEPPKFIFNIPLEPVVELGKYRSIRLPYDWKEPGEDKVEEAVEEMRRMYSTTQTVERPAQAGDFSLIDVKGTKVNAAEGEAPVVDYKSYPIFLRADKKEDELPYPGFSSHLVGLKPGENKSFSHKFAKGDKNEALRGQTVKYEITVKAVRGVLLPELNDEFAKQVGAFENVQALRDGVRASLTARSKADYDNDYFMRLVDKIKEGATIKYPPQVLEHEVEHVIEDVKGRLAEQSMDLEAYLKSRQMDNEKFIEEEARPAAVRRLERSLIMDEVAKAEKIEVQEQTFNTVFQQTYSEMQSSSEFQKFMRTRNALPKRMTDAIAMESASRAITQDTLQRLKEIAAGQAEAGEEKLAKARQGAKSRAKPASGSGVKAVPGAGKQPKKKASSKAG